MNTNFFKTFNRNNYHQILITKSYFVFFNNTSLFQGRNHAICDLGHKTQMRSLQHYNALLLQLLQWFQISWTTAKGRSWPSDHRASDSEPFFAMQINETAAVMTFRSQRYFLLVFCDWSSVRVWNLFFRNMCR